MFWCCIAIFTQTNYVSANNDLLYWTLKQANFIELCDDFRWYKSNLYPKQVS